MKIHVVEVWTDEEGALNVIEAHTNVLHKLPCFASDDPEYGMNAPPVPRTKYPIEQNVQVEFLYLDKPEDKNRYEDVLKTGQLRIAKEQK